MNTSKAVIAVLTIAGLYWYVSTSRAEIASLRADLHRTQQNYEARGDTLRVTENKLGHFESARLGFIGQLGELERENNALLNKIARVEGDLEVAIAASLHATSDDTVSISADSVSNDGATREAFFTYDPPLPEGNRLLVRWQTTVTTDSIMTKVFEHEVSTDIVLAQRLREDGLREVVAMSSWPGLVEDVQGFVIPTLVEPRPKSRWKRNVGIGMVIGAALWEALR